MSRGNQSLPLPEFHPQTLIREWDNGDAFHLSDALTGVCVFGATGSGKTSGPAKHLAYGYLAHDFGGLVLCAKKEERRQWQEWAANTGRTDDLIIIDGEGNWRFNFLEWEASRPAEGGGLTINIVAILDEIASAVASSSGKETMGGGDNKFWEDALHHMNTNLVSLPLLAGVPVSLPLMRAIVATAPQSEEQVGDPHWNETSTCAAILAEADKATLQLTDRRADFDECRNYWLQEYPALGEKVRGIISLTFSMLANPLLTHPLRKLFSLDTNVRPEDTFDGKIVIVDLPVQEFRLAGKIASLAWKFCFQVAVMRRPLPVRRDEYLRPVFLWADEAQNFVTKFDAEYQAVARSAGGCTVYLTQNRESFLRVLGSFPAVDSLLGNLQAKFFCQNTGDTNEWAAALLGERWTHVTSTSVG
ncbi:MAG TPA: TraM recognition domain-containing protein, partial [Verrucomicrobiae bacterium]